MPHERYDFIPELLREPSEADRISNRSGRVVAAVVQNLPHKPELFRVGHFAPLPTLAIDRETSEKH